MNRPPFEPLLPQPPGYAVRQNIEDHFYVLIPLQIPGRCGAVADALNNRLILEIRYWRAVQPVGEAPQHVSNFSKLGTEDFNWRLSKFPYGMNAEPIQFSFGGRPYIQQIGHRQRPGSLAVIFFGNQRYGVRLAVVAAKLRKNFIIAYTDTHGNSQFFPDSFPDLLGCLFSLILLIFSAGDIQPCLVQAKRFHPATVIQINVSC